MKTKKLFSLLVVFTLVFSLFTVSNVQAANDEFAILRTLGITTDFSDKTTPLTRYELAEIALELTKASPEPNGNPVYPDIPVKHKYFPVVNAVTNKGLMGATFDGSFSPDSIASSMDAGRVLLSELGYAGFAQQAGWTDFQYLSKVKSLGLTSGVESSESLTHYSFGKMIINMLTKNTLEVVSVGQDGIKYAESSLTYIESKYGYVVRTGVLQAAGETSMSGYATLATNRVSLDGVKYSTDGQDFTKYVGYNVKCILTNRNSDAKVIFVGPNIGFNELKISAKDITNVTTNGTDYTISYLDENESAETVSFKNSARVVVNGQNVADSSKILKYLKPDVGGLTLVDTDSDEMYDIIHVDSKIYIKVGGVTETSISDQFTNNTIALDDVDFYVYNNGAKINVTSVETDSYATVAAGDIDFQLISGNEIIVPNMTNSERIVFEIVAPTTLKGEVGGIVSDKVLIDGVLYDYSPYYKDLLASGYVKPLALNEIAEVALNENNEIIDVISTTSDYATSDATGRKYGYMLNMASVSGISSQAVLRLIDLETLTEQKLVTSEDCKLNGKKFDFNKLKDVDPTTTATSLYYADGTTFKDQLIKYKVNKENEVCEIFMYVDRANSTIINPVTNYNQATDGTHPYGQPSLYTNNDYDPEYLGYDNNNFSLDFMGMSYGYAESMNNLYTFKKGETMVVNIPVDADDREDLRKWEVYKDVEFTTANSPLMTFSYDASRTTRTELYDVSPLYIPSVVISREPPQLTTDVIAFSFNDTFDEAYRTGVVIEKMNIYDEVTNSIKLQVKVATPTPSGVQTKIYIPSVNDLAMSTGYFYKDASGNNADKSGFVWSDLEIGDFITVKIDKAGEVSGFVVLAEHNMVSNSNYFGPLTCYNANFIIAYYTNVDVGYVTKSNGKGGFLMNIQGAAGPVSAMQFVGGLNANPGGIRSAKGGGMIYYAGTGKYERASLEDAKVGDRVIVHRKNGTPMEIFIIR